MVGDRVDRRQMGPGITVDEEVMVRSTVRQRRAGGGGKGRLVLLEDAVGEGGVARVGTQHRAILLDAQLVVDRAVGEGAGDDDAAVVDG